MANKNSAPVKSSTQKFTEVEAVKDDVLMMQDYSCSIVIQSGAVNFGLLAEEEQRAMIYSYASLLNSLSFSVQISILSKRMDISSYLDYLDERVTAQRDPILHEKILEYQDFIKTIVKKNTILEKNFYFIIPFNRAELGVTSTGKKKLNPEYVFTRAKTALYPKRDHLLRLLYKTGIGGKVLYEQELSELFFNLYNPSTTGAKLAPIKNYTDTILTP